MCDRVTQAVRPCSAIRGFEEPFPGIAVILTTEQLDPLPSLSGPVSSPALQNRVFLKPWLTSLVAGAFLCALFSMKKQLIAIIDNNMYVLFANCLDHRATDRQLRRWLPPAPATGPIPAEPLHCQHGCGPRTIVRRLLGATVAVACALVAGCSWPGRVSACRPW